jgi:lambda family phage minor tail protein L
VVVNNGGLVGAKVTRRRTFECYLDGYPLADSAAQFPADVFYINRRSKHNKEFIEWELITKLDDENLYLPKEQILRDYCPFRYRHYDTTTSGFDYTYVSRCPYDGDNYFSITGVSGVSASEDICGKRRYDCEIRFPDQEIPFGGIPGAGTLKPPYRT